MKKQPRVLIQTDDGQELTNFDFVYSDANGIYLIDDDFEFMGIMLNGTEHVLEYNAELYEEIKKNIAIRNLMDKN